MSFGLVYKEFTLLLSIIFRGLDSLVFKEIIDLIPFHGFLRLLMLFQSPLQLPHVLQSPHVMYFLKSLFFQLNFGFLL